MKAKHGVCVWRVKIYLCMARSQTWLLQLDTILLKMYREVKRYFKSILKSVMNLNPFERTNGILIIVAPDTLALKLFCVQLLRYLRSFTW